MLMHTTLCITRGSHRHQSPVHSLHIIRNLMSSNSLAFISCFQSTRSYQIAGNELLRLCQANIKVGGTCIIEAGVGNVANGQITTTKSPPEDQESW